MKATTQAAKFLPTPDQVGMLSGIVLIFFWEVLEHYTHWDFRACFLLAALPVWVTQGLLFKTPPKKWAIQVGLSTVVLYFGWELLSRVWK